MEGIRRQPARLQRRASTVNLRFKSNAYGVRLIGREGILRSDCNSQH